MLKQSIGLLFLSMFISFGAFAEDYPPFDATIKYFAPCPSKDYKKCASENRIIKVKNLADNAKIGDIKDAIFKHEKENSKFKPEKQVLTCREIWPNDTDFADICWDDKLEGVSAELNLR